MEDTRDAIRQGRVLAAEGLEVHAMKTWRAALSGAYKAQDFAGLFVLSVNIGELCLLMAKESMDEAKSFELLQEAKTNFAYALQIVETCALRQVLGGYSALYQGVRRVETLKSTAEKLMKLQHLKTQECTTCGGADEVVLDEKDGCFYCKKCYEEYYAVETKGEAGILHDDDVDDEWKSQGDHGDVENVTLKSDTMTEAAASGDEQIQETDEETKVQAHASIEDVKRVRIRYERVQLGSLAVFLAGTPHVEKQVNTQQNASSAYIPFPGDIPPAYGLNEVLRSEHTTAMTDCDEERCDSDPALALDKAGGTAATTSKRVYSIVNLLDLQESSPICCPETLMASPVRDDGSSLTPSRNKRSKPRKNSNSKTTTRSAASSPTATSEIPDATSQLPTLDLCIAMRKSFKAREKSRNCSNFRLDYMYG
ncbi:hypothetical protein PHMEG_00014729 [Phytophthora megakarya]|uniref:Uncharacterized protein n=1 Tax=Phytophthora megakarya TaxID=4795 RepID=A0A225W3K9_9STRA|nr:hypothetical protein PHMEG_00014729 [Phytophthora megakarya]